MGCDMRLARNRANGTCVRSVFRVVEGFEGEGLSIRSAELHSEGVVR